MLDVAIARDCMKSHRNNMLSHPPDDSLLLIRCPSCGQRFKVGEDLRDRTVECGGCEGRFRINDEVIIRGRKFYPGERKDPGLNRYQRVPLAIMPPGPGTHTISYTDAPDPAMLEPASPQRVIAGAVGVAGMVLMTLLLMFGGARGGMLDGMALENRLVMAGFASLMGVVLLIYANPKARRKALAFGMLLSAGVMSVPFVFTAGSVRIESAQKAIPDVFEKSRPLEVVQEASDTQALRNRIGTDPLVKEINRLAREGSQKQAVGLWLRGLSEMNRLLVRDYIFRTTGADPSSANYYPRGNNDFLMVVTGARQSLQELAEVTSALGHTEKIYPEISVIEVRVNNENFSEGPIEKLSKKDDPAFYDLNKRELESIDLERVKRAVQRLAEAEPKLYRSDITRRLIMFLSDDSIEFKGEVCRALATWAEVPGPASDAAVVALKDIMAKKATVPTEMIALIVKEKNVSVIPYLDELWMKDPTTWESLYGDLGQPIEETLINHLVTAEGSLRHSVVRLLGRVGGKKVLPVLAALAKDAEPEMKVLIEQAERLIKERTAE
jgi:hypothetical protein